MAIRELYRGYQAINKLIKGGGDLGTFALHRGEDPAVRYADEIKRYQSQQERMWKKRKASVKQGPKLSKRLKSGRSKTRTQTKTSRVKTRRRQPARSMLGSVARFRKRKPVNRPSMYFLKGTVQKREVGGVFKSIDNTVSPAEERGVLYLGHSCFNRDQIILSVSRAILRELLRKDGQCVDNFVEVWPAAVNYIIRLWFTPDMQTADAELSDIGFTTGNSYVDAAAQIAELLKRPYNAVGTDGAQKPLFDRVELLVAERPVSTIILKQSMLHYCFSSYLTMQNRTLAASDAALPEAEKDSALDIANNPLTGKRYMGAGNGLYVRSDQPGFVADEFYANTQTGLIRHVPKGGSFVENERVSLSKPPRAQFFSNCKKATSVSLNPGEIKTSYLKCEMKRNFNVFMRQMHSPMELFANGDPKTTRTSMGTCEIFGLEKRIDSRINEPTIAVAFQLDQEFKSYITSTNMVRINRLNDVQPGVV
ncbi:MAG: capsid protein [Circoviridae sp.]|nr:MAG: capsid protein [Circoviridae sp.]